MLWFDLLLHRLKNPKTLKETANIVSQVLQLSSKDARRIASQSYLNNVKLERDVKKISETKLIPEENVDIQGVNYLRWAIDRKQPTILLALHSGAYFTTLFKLALEVDRRFDLLVVKRRSVRSHSKYFDVLRNAGISVHEVHQNKNPAKEMVKRLKSGGIVLTFFDLPEHESPGKRKHADVLGMSFHFPSAPFRIARTCNANIIPMITLTDPDRHTSATLFPPIKISDDTGFNSAFEKVAGYFNEVLLHCPGSWLIWGWCPGFINPID